MITAPPLANTVTTVSRGQWFSKRFYEIVDPGGSEGGKH